MGRARKSRIGEEYGMLAVVDFGGVNEDGESLWVCECSCKPKPGRNRVTVAHNVLRGGKKSCGCLRRGPAGGINGFLRSPRRPEAVELWSLGWSLTQIARRLEVTKQRVHQYVREHLTSLGEKERVEAEEAHRSRSHGSHPFSSRGAEGDAGSGA